MIGIWIGMPPLPPVPVIEAIISPPSGPTNPIEHDDGEELRHANTSTDVILHEED